MQIRITFREGEYNYDKEKIVIIDAKKFTKKLLIEEANKITEFIVDYCLVGYSLDKQKVRMGRKTYTRYTKITKKFIVKSDKFIMTNNIKYVRNI